MRHRRGLLLKQVKPSLAQPLRRSLAAVLKQHASACYDGWGSVEGYEEFGRAEASVLRETGEASLYYFVADNKRQPGNIDNVIVYGYPSDAMDAVEACLHEFPLDQRAAVEAGLNEALSNHRSSWRLASGEFVQVESRYLEEEALRPAADLLQVAGFDGPLREFSEISICAC